MTDEELKALVEQVADLAKEVADLRREIRRIAQDAWVASYDAALRGGG